MASNDSSYTNMKGEVEAIGAHCQMPYCHILDFLPFRCESCKGTFCLDHRTEYTHNCPKQGEWARRKAGSTQNSTTNTPLAPKPSVYNNDQQCADPRCKTFINTARAQASHCPRCNREYCLKHRFEQDHNCTTTPAPRPPPPRTQTALARLKAWADQKRTQDATRRSGSTSSKKPSFLSFARSSSSSTSSAAQADLNALKRASKGDASIPAHKRIYLHVEASADTTTAKYPTGKFFFNKEWSVGRVLDDAAKALQVQNVNNRGGGEEDRLRVFWVEGGRLLKFGERVGEVCCCGDMVVLLRGVGSGEAVD
ncbi:AN1 zinc finger protein-like protein [Decorospora gaudefroyi]|uniref:AN1 zinc finger protein-like protein n=1 Tax=Decorospora gaudefroyi TaxID=184978 RepID=A0A6A5K647_9PLEO|nr:AN1 zinc finger protein-like protein [Decorospora gaudefroyi]